jgi:hypothetical protein
MMRGFINFLGMAEGICEKHIVRSLEIEEPATRRRMSSRPEHARNAHLLELMIGAHDVALGLGGVVDTLDPGLGRRCYCNRMVQRMDARRRYGADPLA